MKAKTIILIVLFFLLALILAAIAYGAYVLIDYHRLPDWQRLEIADNPSREIKTGTSYKVLSWNVGFGAYSEDYSFFMDGGKYSRAYSEQEVITNISAVSDLVNREAPDLIVFQEVDLDSTRSYHVNEEELLASMDGTVLSGAGDTAIFIYPGVKLKATDALITNFHLPQSTLLMLVSALMGREEALRVYREAVKERYRFFSFGDAMFIE